MARIDSRKALLRPASKLVAGTMAATLALTGAAGMIATQAAEAATYQQPGNGQTIAGRTFTWAGSSYGGGNISVKYQGAWRTLTENALSPYVTNGKTLYYVKAGTSVQQTWLGYSYRGSVYRVNVKTGKKTKIASGKFDGVETAKGRYVYAYTYDDLDYALTRLYAIDTKTKKKRLMQKLSTGTVQCKGKYVFTTPSYGEIGNYPLYLYKANGLHKKKVATGFGGKLTKKYVYYVKYSYSKSKYRAYRYSIKSGKKKAVTGWTKPIEAVAKYWVNPNGK